MDTNVIDLAKDKKIADFADVVKQKLKQKLADNDFVKSTKDELEKIQSISKSLTDISNKGKDAETKSDDDTKTDVENKTDDEVKTTDDVTTSNDDTKADDEVKTDDEIKTDDDTKTDDEVKTDDVPADDTKAVDGGEDKSNTEE